MQTAQCLCSGINYIVYFRQKRVFQTIWGTILRITQLFWCCFILQFCFVCSLFMHSRHCVIKQIVPAIQVTHIIPSYEENAWYFVFAPFLFVISSRISFIWSGQNL